MFNERATQFYRASQCMVTRQFKTDARMGTKTKIFGTKTEYIQINFGVLVVFFSVRCFKALNVQFHSNSFIQKCPSHLISFIINSYYTIIKYKIVVKKDKRIQCF